MNSRDLRIAQRDAFFEAKAESARLLRETAIKLPRHEKVLTLDDIATEEAEIEKRKKLPEAKQRKRDKLLMLVGNKQPKMGKVRDNFPSLLAIFRRFSVFFLSFFRPFFSYFREFRRFSFDFLSSSVDFSSIFAVLRSRSVNFLSILLSIIVKFCSLSSTFVDFRRFSFDFVGFRRFSLFQAHFRAIWS